MQLYLELVASKCALKKAIDILKFGKAKKILLIMLMNISYEDIFV